MYYIFRGIIKKKFRAGFFWTLRLVLILDSMQKP
jgi:hypothetical protein